MSETKVMEDISNIFQVNNLYAGSTIRLSLKRLNFKVGTHTGLTCPINEQLISHKSALYGNHKNRHIWFVFVGYQKAERHYRCVYLK